MRAALLTCFVLSCSALRAQPAPQDSTSQDSVAVESRAAFDALPLRSVREVAALAPGVRRDLATGALTVRSRSGEPVFMVDGVRQLGGARLPFEAVARVGVRTEGVSARYGQAAGGLVMVETEAGGEAFGGRLEGFSSRATDAFGRDLGALSVRGPLGGRGGFSLSAEIGQADDASPYGGDGYFALTDDAFARVQTNPQSISVTEGGVQRFVPFPAAAARAAFDQGETFSDADLRAALGVGSTARFGGLLSTAETLGDDDYIRRRAKDDPLSDLRLAGTVGIEPLAGLRLRIGGRLDRQRAEHAEDPLLRYQTLLLNPDAGYQGETDGRAGWLQASYRVAPSLSFRASGSLESREETLYPRGFSSDIRDALFYGDIDRPEAELARSYASRVSGGSGYEPANSRDSYQVFSSQSTVFPGFSLPSSSFGMFRQRESATAQLAGAVVLDLAGARVEIGGDLERETYRQYQLKGFGLAQYYQDGTNVRAAIGQPLTGVQIYEELSYQALQPFVRSYGYTFDGLAETDDGSAGSLLDRLDSDGLPLSADIAPFHPTTVAGYAEASGDLGPLAVRVGVRVETYSRGGETLFDAFANRPIVRAGSLARRPEGIGEDFAVYFANGTVGAQNVVGFRDLDGVVYDAAGQVVRYVELEARSGRPVIDESQPRSAAFTSSPSHTSFQPRVGLQFAVSPALSLSASYDRLTRRPPPGLHSTVAEYTQPTFSARLVAPDLRPETVDAVRLGADAEVSPTLAISAAMFHRRSDDGIVVRPTGIALSPYSLYINDGFSRETGADLALAWTPAATLTATASYTLAFAKSSDADPVTLGSIAFLDDNFPEFLSPDPEGTRHEFDAIVALRTPDRFGGIDVGMVLSAQSGLPYTALQDCNGFTVNDGFTCDTAGEINSARLPWTSQLDLRVSKAVRVASASFEVFGWVENLLGSDNVLALYRSTGQPDSDGYTRGDIGDRRFEGRSGARRLYDVYTDAPVNVGGRQSTSNPYVYGQPRQIRLGIRATL